MINSQAKAVGRGPQRLADFIRHNQPAIIKEWTDFARTRSPASDKMSKLALEDHIVDILKFIADDLESPKLQLNRSTNLAVWPPRRDRFARVRLKFMPLYVSLTVLISIKWFRNIGRCGQVSLNNG